MASDPDCYDEVEKFIRQADTAGMTLEEVAFFANGALAVYCYGYTWDDVYGVPQKQRG